MGPDILNVRFGVLLWILSESCRLTGVGLTWSKVQDIWPRQGVDCRRAFFKRSVNGINTNLEPSTICRNHLQPTPGRHTDPVVLNIALNQVVEAQKTAEANVIRRREETSATRSLHNTAKLMENNPTLLRLKELEALEKVSERVNQINVYGGLDGLMNGTVKLF